ncbi:acyl carrier protein [Streptomyces sp. NPDC054786]
MNQGPVTDEAICQIIGSVLPKAAAKGGVTPSMNLRADLGIDSLALMSIVFVLEEQAGIDAFSKVDRFIGAEDVSDIIDIVRKS